MRLEIDTNGMRIVPETPQDAAFLENGYGIKGIGDTLTGEYLSHFDFSAYGSYAIKFKSIKKDR